MKFAVVGAGVIGETHARLITSLPGEAELVAVVDVEADRAAAMSSKYGGEPMTELEKACARPDIDAVSICLPSGLHADAAITALEAGRHVVVEKPIDVTLAAADRLIDVEQRTGLTVAVISQRRFQHAPAFVHQAVAEGRLGRITAGIAESAFWRSQEYYDSGGWRGTVALDGGGALMNQGIHVVDLLLWMLGEPVEVQAYSDLLAHERIDVEDTVAATVRFRSGAIGSIVATTAAYPGRPVRLSVYGDRGSAVIEQDDLVAFDTADGEPADQARSAQPVADGEPAAEASVSRSVADAHRDQYLDFIAAVRDGRPPSIGTQDARRALEVVLGIYESARTGGPVQLSGRQ
ncbi:putative dehydrogenase [Kribbella steppae]|uniref:Putative dehydrogenase n=1 Tax=Kribbella steppae TaxID=2512223 RepID=A0A4R2I0Z3_9ACTN|nr:Gfo/Idh/MocA family oxidoreductase [Kribbella steppae]TCO36035.1 putative dehydrogenase [Kribbella steppae]